MRNILNIYMFNMMLNTDCSLPPPPPHPQTHCSLAQCPLKFCLQNKEINSCCIVCLQIYCMFINILLLQMYKFKYIIMFLHRKIDRGIKHRNDMSRCRNYFFLNVKFIIWVHHSLHFQVFFSLFVCYGQPVL